MLRELDELTQVAKRCPVIAGYSSSAIDEPARLLLNNPGSVSVLFDWARCFRISLRVNLNHVPCQCRVRVARSCLRGRPLWQCLSKPLPFRFPTTLC
jgi:hypothetical protein